MVDDPDHLLARLERLNTRLGRDLGLRHAVAGLPWLRGSQGRILNLIGPDGSRPTELAEGAWVSKQAIGKRIVELEQRGLVRTKPDPSDGRAVLVHLTKEGARVRAVVVAQIDDLERQLAEEVGAASYARFSAVLARLGGGV